MHRELLSSSHHTYGLTVVFSIVCRCYYVTTEMHLIKYVINHYQFIQQVHAHVHVSLQAHVAMTAYDAD
jgi:hypothetical protein